jgi:hypothetical protein
MSVTINVIEKLRYIRSYTPLLLSFSENISTSLALLISVGLISYSTACEIIQERKEIKQDGLYYLFNTKKMLNI